MKACRKVRNTCRDILPLADRLLIALRVEWCKSRARAMRLSEEVILLREEMRRVLAYLVWHEEWWLEQGTRRGDEDPQLTEGLLAYAAKQADIRHEMRDSFNHLWRHSAEFCALGVDPDSEILDLRLAADYILATPSEIDQVVPSEIDQVVSTIPSSPTPTTSFPAA